MDKSEGSVSFQELQRVARDLDRAAQIADHARQIYIASRDEHSRKCWIEALREQRSAWDKLWTKHRDFIGELV